MPTLFTDINKRMDAWGREEKINPFKDIYKLVFPMTFRMASCEELANNQGSIQKMRDHYWKLKKSATPVNLLLPWFTGTAKRNKNQATKDLHAMVFHYMDVRRKAKVPNSDAIDVLIADGEDDTMIFVVNVVSLTVMIFTLIISQ